MGFIANMSFRKGGFFMNSIYGGPRQKKRML